MRKVDYLAPCPSRWNPRANSADEAMPMVLMQPMILISLQKKYLHKKYQIHRTISQGFHKLETREFEVS